MNKQKARDDLRLFSGNRERTILRDQNKCVQCGMTRTEHYDKYGRDITVDHIDGKGCWDKEGGQRNDLENLQTLCLGCHGIKDIQKKPNVGMLTNSQVINIRHCKGSISGTELAKIYGVTEMCISYILRGLRRKLI